MSALLLIPGGTIGGMAINTRLQTSAPRAPAASKTAGLQRRDHESVAHLQSLGRAGSTHLAFWEPLS